MRCRHGAIDASSILMVPIPILLLHDMLVLGFRTSSWATIGAEIWRVTLYCPSQSYWNLPLGATALPMLWLTRSLHLKVWPKLYPGTIGLRLPVLTICMTCPRLMEVGGRAEMQTSMRG